MPGGESEQIVLNAKDFLVLRSGVAPIDALGCFRHNRALAYQKAPGWRLWGKFETHLQIFSDFMMIRNDTHPEAPGDQVLTAAVGNDVRSSPR
jgi:hypothetical protein